MAPSEVSPLRSLAGTALALDHCSIAQENIPRGTTQRTAQFKVGQPIPQKNHGEVVATVSPHGHDNGSFVFYEGSHERVYGSVHLL